MWRFCSCLGKSVCGLQVYNVTFYSWVSKRCVSRSAGVPLSLFGSAGRRFDVEDLFDDAPLPSLSNASGTTSRREAERQPDSSLGDDSGAFLEEAEHSMWPPEPREPVKSRLSTLFPLSSIRTAAPRRLRSPLLHVTEGAVSDRTCAAPDDSAFTSLEEDSGVTPVSEGLTETDDESFEPSEEPTELCNLMTEEVERIFTHVDTEVEQTWLTSLVPTEAGRELRKEKRSTTVASASDHLFEQQTVTAEMECVGEGWRSREKTASSNK